MKKRSKTKSCFVRLLCVVFFMVLALTAWNILPRIFHGPIYMDWENSWFSDFMEIDGMAYSRCNLTVNNDTGAHTYVRISATANLYDQRNLYAGKNLTGYTQDLRSEIFPLETGANEILVYLGAPFGGNCRRFNKSLPGNIRFEQVDADDPEITCISGDLAFGGELLLDNKDASATESELFYDFDRDGDAEKLILRSAEYDQKDGSHPRRVVELELYEGETILDKLEIGPFFEKKTVESVHVHDFGFSDGSLELIVSLNGMIGMQLLPDGEMEWDSMPEVALVRVLDGRLLSDTGSIYGSGRYHVQPAETQPGTLYSIVGNRVTLENGIPPIRIDLGDRINWNEPTLDYR